MSTIMRQGPRMRVLPEDLRRLASLQAGVLRSSQLAEHGYNAREIDARLRAGVWRRVSSRVVALQPDAPARAGLLWAASLHHHRVGLTGAAALEVEGLPAPRDGRIQLLGPRGTRQLPFDACRIFTTDAPPFADVPGPMRTPIALSVAYAMGSALSVRQAAFHCTWAVQRRLTSLDAIRQAIEHAPTSPTMAAARRVLEQVDPGVHSIHEFDFAKACRRRGLPSPARQVPRTDSEGRPRYTDVEFTMPHGTVVVEIDGIQHIEPEQWFDDSWRANEVTAQDATVLRIPGPALRLHGDRFFDQLTRALVRAGWRTFPVPRTGK